MSPSILPSGSAALYGGLRAGALATVISAAVADFLDRAGREFRHNDRLQWLEPGHFCDQRRAGVLGRRQLAEGGRQLRRTEAAQRQELERLVAERTAELERQVAQRRDAKRWRETPNGGTARAKRSCGWRSAPGAWRPGHGISRPMPASGTTSITAFWVMNRAPSRRTMMHGRSACCLKTLRRPKPACG